MAEYEASLVINRPVEQVFAFAEHPANLPLWAEGVQEMALLKGGAVAAGAKVCETISLFGKLVEAKGTVAAYEVHRFNPGFFTNISWRPRTIRMSP